jgi:hypothetical protein
MNTTSKNIIDICNNWVDTVGVRLFAPEHGCANGHRYYLSTSFISGYSFGIADNEEIKALKEENNKLKKLLNYDYIPED